MSERCKEQSWEERVWETATVIPLLKTGSQTEVKNYRPIALLPSLSKVFEKLLHKHI